MGLFDINENSINAQYDKACRESGHGNVDPQNYPNLDRELMAYSVTHNCTYDEAYMKAKTGRNPDGSYGTHKSYYMSDEAYEIERKSNERWCICFFIVVFILVVLFCN